VLLFLFAVIVIYFSKKKETEFLLAAELFIYGSDTVQNRFFGGISIGLLFPKGKRRSKQDSW
jgi:hypothetical protein